MREPVTAITETFRQKTVVIVGDLVADQFLHGTISRVSREAPVFILRHDLTVTVPGAAANAAANVASLGGTPILIGIAGQDSSGEKLTRTLEESGVDCGSVITAPEFGTTTKVRVLAGQQYAGRQQVIRIDYENPMAIANSVKSQLRQNLAEAVAEADAIILSDYNYGAIFPEIVQDARGYSKKAGIPLIVDSRYALETFDNATTATPNREEVEQILGKDFTADACSHLRERLGLEALLVTNGNQGMTLFREGEPVVQIDAVGSSEPVDVTGAGDTVIAAYALGLASGMSFLDAATIANHAGGIVVMKKGTACVYAGELVESLKNTARRLASTQIQ